MVQFYLNQIGNYEGMEVKIKGWLSNKRSSGKIDFLMIRDGTGIIQAVAFRPEISTEIVERCKTVTLESSVIVTGVVHKEMRAPSGYELSLRDIEIVQLATDYPITLKEHGVDFLLDHRHLWLRSSRPYAILKIRAEVIRASHEFLYSHGFTCVDPPILVPTASEGTTTLFPVKYYDDTVVYLSQSGQLYMEAAAMAFGKVYCYSPAFRAEKSKTRRHLTEFWMIEPEVAYADLNDIINLIEEFVAFLVQSVVRNCRNELVSLGRDLSLLERVASPFPRITYNDALLVLKRHNVDVAWGHDLGGEDETIISNEFKLPVFITHYPTESKPFYMKPDSIKPEVSLSVDLIAPEGYGEIVGGGQRLDDLLLLEKRLKEHGLTTDSYQWYLDLRRYGSVPHSGFGLGVERTLAWLCGVSHVRETALFPRMLYRIMP